MRYELSLAFVSHEYFTLPPRLTTGKAVYSNKRELLKSFTWFTKRHEKCIPGLLGGRGHRCTAIDDVETSHGFLHTFVACSTAVRLGSSLILSYWSTKGGGHTCNIGAWILDKSTYM